MQGGREAAVSQGTERRKGWLQGSRRELWGHWTWALKDG